MALIKRAGSSVIENQVAKKIYVKQLEQEQYIKPQAQEQYSEIRIRKIGNYKCVATKSQGIYKITEGKSGYSTEQELMIRANKSDTCEQIELAKFLKIKRNYCKLSKIKEYDLHHRSATWDEVNTSLFKKDKHKEWHSNHKELHRIDIKKSVIQ